VELRYREDILGHQLPVIPLIGFQANGTKIGESSSAQDASGRQTIRHSPWQRWLTHVGRLPAISTAKFRRSSLSRTAASGRQSTLARRGHLILIRCAIGSHGDAPHTRRLP